MAKTKKAIRKSNRIRKSRKYTKNTRRRLKKKGGSRRKYIRKQRGGMKIDAFNDAYLNTEVPLDTDEAVESFLWGFAL